MSSSPESRTLGTDGVDDRGGGTDEASEGEVAGAGKGSASEGLEVRGADAAAGATAGTIRGGLTATAGASSTAGGGGGVGRRACVGKGGVAALVRAGVRRQRAGAGPKAQGVPARPRAREARGRRDRGRGGRRDRGAGVG